MGWKAVAASAAAALPMLLGCSGAGGSQPLGHASASSPLGEATSKAPGLIVTSGQFQVSLTLTGTTADSAAVAIDVPDGLAFSLSNPQGGLVRAGARLGRFEIPKATKSALSLSARSSTAAASRLSTLEGEEGPVRAPVAGVVQVIDGSPVLDTPGLDMVVQMDPLQVLRYYSVPFVGTAGVETVFGYETVTCAALWIDSAPAPSLHCRLPEGLETAAGLPGALVLRSRALNSVIAIPEIYVGYDQTTQSFFVILRRSGHDVKQYIVVGATDGVRRVIISGLHLGDVLVPLQPSGL